MKRNDIIFEINCTKTEFIETVKARTLEFDDSPFFGIIGTKFRDYEPIRSKFYEKNFIVYSYKDIHASPEMFRGVIKEHDNRISISGGFKPITFYRIQPFLIPLFFIATGLPINTLPGFLFCMASIIIPFGLSKLGGAIFRNTYSKAYKRVLDFLQQVANEFNSRESVTAGGEDAKTQ